jgi:hypothetical protein
MSEDLLSPGNMTIEELARLFEEAYMEVSIDADGDLLIEDEYRCFLRPDLDGRLLAACAVFGARPYADEQAKLRFVNRVNDGLILIRGSVTTDGRFFFDYYIPIEGGATRKAVVLAVRRFLSYLGGAMDLDTENVVASQDEEEEAAATAPREPWSTL